MRSLVMAVAALLLSATMGSLQAQYVDVKPFVTKINGLVTYLDLAPYQVNEVDRINDYFIQMQSESLQGNPRVKEKKMQYAIFANLKLMKGALTEEQYRKYIQLLNVTNNNNRMLGGTAISDIYLADTDTKSR